LSLGLYPEEAAAMTAEQRTQWQREREDTRAEGEVDLVDTFAPLPLSAALQQEDLLPALAPVTLSFPQEDLEAWFPSLPWTSLHRVTLPEAGSLAEEVLLGEEYLMPPEGEEEVAVSEGAAAEESKEEDSAMEVDAGAPAAASAAPASGAPAKKSSDPPVAPWLDEPAVLSVQSQIERVVEAAGPDGLGWAELRKRFLALSVADFGAAAASSSSLAAAAVAEHVVAAQQEEFALPASEVAPPLRPSSSVLRKAFARSQSLLVLLRVRTFDDAASHVVHARFSQLWCVPEFKEILLPAPAAPAGSSASAAAAAVEQPPVVKVVADFSDTAITAAPWRTLGGDALDRERLAAHERAVLSILLLQPGMSVAALGRRLPVLMPAELDELLSGMEQAGKVQMQRRQVDRPASLFSQPDDLGDEDEQARARKKRRRLAAPSAVPPLQRYVFPTARAFEV